MSNDSFCFRYSHSVPISLVGLLPVTVQCFSYRCFQHFFVHVVASDAARHFHFNSNLKLTRDLWKFCSNSIRTKIYLRGNILSENFYDEKSELREILFICTRELRWLFRLWIIHENKNEWIYLQTLPFSHGKVPINSVCYVHSTATKLTTTFRSISVGVDKLVIPWTRPKFLPYAYKQRANCTLFCDHKTYYINEAILDGAETSITLFGLRPGSVCFVKHHAVYNPASIDPGIKTLAYTFYSSKFQWLTFLMN